jgi:hypothetical protein
MKKPLVILRFTATVIFLLLGFFYFLLFIDPSLIDFKQQPLFLFDRNFLGQFLVYPGGFTEYINLFILQFFVSGFTGSLLLTIILGFSILLSNRILREFTTGNSLWFIRFIPGILLISLHSHYKIDLATDVVFLFVLFFTWIFLLLNDQKNLIKLPVLILSSILLYYLLGGTALLTYTLFIIAAEIVFLRKNHWYVSIPIAIALALLLPWLTSVSSAYLDFKKAVIGIIEIAKGDKMILVIQLIIVGILPLFILLSLIWKSIGSKIKLKPVQINMIGFSIPVLLLTITLLTMVFSFNQNEKNSLLLHYNAKNNNWNEVLKMADKLSLDDRKVLFQINRALYHQGRLVDEMFSYSQLWGEHGLILTTYYNSEVLMYCSDLFFDMGHIKGALHWAYEAQTKFDKSPDILKRIALCNLLLGEYPTAEKFLNILSKSKIHKKWAEKYLPFLNNEAMIAGDPFLSEKRKLIPHEDFYSNTQHPQYDLYMLLTQHPENKMAFEYFIADALLNHDVAKVVVNLKYLEKLGYEKIPVHIEEALMMFLTMNKEYKVDLGKYQISQETQKNFIAYSKLLMKYRQNRMEGQPEIYRNFGNTYWYYIHFVSPITTKRVFQEK